MEEIKKIQKISELKAVEIALLHTQVYLQDRINEIHDEIYKLNGSENAICFGEAKRKDS